MEEFEQVWTQKSHVELRGLGLSEKTLRSQDVINQMCFLAKRMNPDVDDEVLVRVLYCNFSQSPEKRPLYQGLKTTTTSTELYWYKEDRVILPIDHMRCNGWLSPQMQGLSIMEQRDLIGESIPLQMFMTMMYSIVICVDFEDLWDR